MIVNLAPLTGAVFDDSITSTMTLLAPTLVAVPDITPAEDKVSPVGSESLDTFQAYGTIRRTICRPRRRVCQRGSETASTLIEQPLEREGV